jgi:hypothetical protein
LSPSLSWDNDDELISDATFEEAIKVVATRDKKLLWETHGLFSLVFKFLPPQYWSLLVQLFYTSLASCFLYSLGKTARIILLSKKESIFSVAKSKPISLMDIFLKIIERLFLIRFQDV